MSEFLGFGAIVAVIVVLGVIGLITFFVLRSWIKVARADEALVISGKKGKSDDGKETNVEVVVNGKAIVNPITRRYETMSLRSRQMSINAVAQSEDNITLRVEAVALVKISSNRDSVRAAAERFASQDDSVEIFTTEQLEGALRGVIARLDVQELMRGRQKFSQEIQGDVSKELATQGLILDSFQIKGITDDDNYIKSLGVPQIQEKWREAEVETINSEREVTRRRISTEEENLVERTDYEANQQDSASRVGQARAEAEQAEKLAEAKAQQAVLDQEVENEQRRLKAEVNAKADSERYRREREADAAAYEDQKCAEAEYNVSEQKANADYYVSEQQAKADYFAAEQRAKATKAEADAQAHAEREVGNARAEAIKAEAAAIQENPEAYLANRAIEILPELMASFTKGYAAIDGLTIIGGDDSSGSSHIAKESAGSMAAMFQTMKETTGIDLSGIINSSAQGSAFGNAMKDSQRSPQHDDQDHAVVYGEEVAPQEYDENY